MASNYNGSQPNSSGSASGGGGGSSSSSSRKNKKSSSEKPKQPQRGLGVAQLEKIRLHSQMGCAYPPGYPPTFPSHQIQDDMAMRVQSAYSPMMASSPTFAYPSPSPSSYVFHPNMMMGQMGPVRYGDSQQSTVPSWSHGNNYFEAQHFGQPTRSLSHHVEGVPQYGGSNHHQRSRSMGSAVSSSSRSNDNEEVDLELRLSI